MGVPRDQAAAGQWTTLGDWAVAYLYTALAVELGVLEVPGGAYERPAWAVVAAAPAYQQELGEAAAPILRALATLLALRGEWSDLELAAARLALFLRQRFAPRFFGAP